MSERIGIAGGGAIASGLACVAAEHGQVVLWARRPDAATAKVEQPDREARRRWAPATCRSPTTSTPCATRRSSSRRSPRSTTPRPRCCAELGGAATNGHDPRHDDLRAVGQPRSPRRPGRPERFVGLHVFNPVAKMDLVELVFPAAGGRRDPRRAPARCARRSARPPSRSPTRPASSSTGCCSRSSSTPWRLLEETGLEPQAIDDCMRMGAGHPMGPLALLDYVGLDVAAAIGRSIGRPGARARRGDDRRRRARQEGRAGLLRVLRCGARAVH